MNILSIPPFENELVRINVDQQTLCVYIRARHFRTDDPSFHISCAYPVARMAAVRSIRHAYDGMTHNAPMLKLSFADMVYDNIILPPHPQREGGVAMSSAMIAERVDSAIAYLMDIVLAAAIYVAETPKPITPRSMVRLNGLPVDLLTRNVTGSDVHYDVFTGLIVITQNDSVVATIVPELLASTDSVTRQNHSGRHYVYVTYKAGKTSHDVIPAIRLLADETEQAAGRLVERFARLVKHSIDAACNRAVKTMSTHSYKESTQLVDFGTVAPKY